LYSKLPYDPIKSFAPVAPLVSFVNAFMCNLKLPVSNVAELVTYAKANPNAISSGSGGNGTTAHLSLEVLKFISGAPIQHIPYKGTSPAMNDVIGGNLACMFDVLATSIPQIKAGTVKALAVTGGKRSRYLPEIPTMTESGLPGYDETVSDLWYGLFAPAQTPKAIVDRLNAEVDKAMNTTAVKERMAAQGFERLKMTSDEFAVFLRADLDKWGKVVKAAGIRPE
jgi:tripartite-type tricarboxylate transporter receptor subunit TctC